MKFEVHIDGNVYSGQLKNVGTYADVAESFYNKMPLEALLVELVSGEYMVLGKQACERAIFFFKE